MALAQAASAANTVLKSPATRAGGWQAIKDVLKNKTVVAAALGFGALWLGADHAVQSYYAHQVNQQVLLQHTCWDAHPVCASPTTSPPPTTHKISNGFCPNPEHGYYVDRHALQTSLTNELLGATRDHYFRVFIGPPCSGKTTLLKHVCKGIGEGAGFVEIGTLVFRWEGGMCVLQGDVCVCTVLKDVRGGALSLVPSFFIVSLHHMPLHSSWYTCSYTQPTHTHTANTHTANIYTHSQS